MTNNEKVIIAKWYITNKLIGIDTVTYNLVKNNEINDLSELEDIIKNKGQQGTALCLRCIHFRNEICHRCSDKGDKGFRFKYTVWKNELIRQNIWNNLLNLK